MRAVSKGSGAHLRAPLLALLLTAVCAGCTPAGGARDADAVEALHLGVIGDQTGTDDLDAAYEHLAEGVETLNGRGLDVVLHTGDLVESGLETDEVRADFERARALLDRLDAPWMLAPGDHDVNPPGWETGSTDRSRETLFLELLREADPSLGEHFWRAREIGGWRVIALYAHDTLHVDPRWGVTYMAQIGDTQRDWLADALREARGGAGIVVFLHQPLWYEWGTWAPVHALLAEAGVDLVIAGHTHYAQRDPVIDGVRYMTIGATGGSTKSGSANAGASHHVAEIALRPETVEVRLLPIDGGAALKPSPRAAMDRVQAVDVMLGRGRVDPSQAPRLEATDCSEPGRVVIDALGSPIDRPLTLRVSGAALSDPAFREGACHEQPAPVACVTPPGYGVQSSNNASVTMTRRFAAPFFTARVDDVSSLRDGLDLVLEAAFTYNGETYRLEKALFAPPICSSR